MTIIQALSTGFPGAGRVMKEMVKVFPEVQWATFGAYEKISSEPDFFFLPAWMPHEYPSIIHSLPKTKIIIVWTSPIIQSEFTPVEFEFLQTIVRLLDMGKIYAIWTGSPDWLSILKKEGRRVFHSPYPVSLPTWQQPRTPNEKPKNLGLFGPLSSPRKNVVVQAIAAKLAECTIHITDPTVEPLLKFIGVKYINHGWLPEARYDELVRQMDMGMQVSIPGAESFSYVCWDFLSRGIPCLTTVDWAPNREGFEFNSEWMAGRITAYNIYRKEPKYLREWAEHFAHERNEQVKETLNKELGLELSVKE